MRNLERTFSRAHKNKIFGRVRKNRDPSCGKGQTELSAASFVCGEAMATRQSEALATRQSGRLPTAQSPAFMAHEPGSEVHESPVEQRKILRDIHLAAAVAIVEAERARGAAAPLSVADPTTGLLLKRQQQLLAAKPAGGAFSRPLPEYSPYAECSACGAEGSVGQHLPCRCWSPDYSVAKALAAPNASSPVHGAVVISQHGVCLAQVHLGRSYHACGLHLAYGHDGRCPACRARLRRQNENIHQQEESAAAARADGRPRPVQCEYLLGYGDDGSDPRVRSNGSDLTAECDCGQNFCPSPALEDPGDGTGPTLTILQSSYSRMRKRVRTQDSRIEQQDTMLREKDTMFEQLLVYNGKLQQRLLDAGVSLLIIA